MAEFLIYINGILEIDADDENKAKEKADKLLNSYKELKVEEAKIADKNTGYWIK